MMWSCKCFLDVIYHFATFPTLILKLHVLQELFPFKAPKLIENNIYFPHNMFKNIKTYKINL